MSIFLNFSIYPVFYGVGGQNHPLMSLTTLDYTTTNVPKRGWQLRVVLMGIWLEGGEL